jgi:hypothetical protein
MFIRLKFQVQYLLSNKIRKNLKKGAKNNVKSHMPTSDIQKSTTTEHTAITFFYY